MPPALPDEDDFSGTEAHLGAAYEAAWLVTVVLAERGGEAALVRFYEAADSGEPLAEPLRDGFDWTEADLVRAWQQRLGRVGRVNDESRRTALVVAAVGGIAFVVLAWWLVPWDPVPGGDLSPVSAGSVFTAEEIQRAEEFSRWARAWSWSSLVVSLLVACWFGFTRGAGDSSTGCAGRGGSRWSWPWPCSPWWAGW